MNAKRNKLSLSVCALMTAASLCLSACTSSNTQKIVQANAFGPIVLKTSEYQAAYDDAGDEQKYKALILLARANIIDNNFDAAKQNITKLEVLATNSVQKDEASIVKAMLLSKQNNNQKASKVLETVKYNSLPKQDISYFLILNSNVNAKLFKETKNPSYQVLAYKNKIALLNFIDRKQDRITVINQSIDLLGALDEATISKALGNAKNSTDKGFYEYSLISRSASADLKQKVLEDFAAKYPTHPINELLAKNTVEVTQTADNSDSQVETGAPVAVNEKSLIKLNDGDTIAVLIPLTGRFASIVGEPARLGVITALKDRNSQSKVNFYDTNKLNISDILKKLQANGTKLIIGPILKPEVETLNKNNQGIPSIVFNQDVLNKPINQWYFDLGPDYEGALAASKVHADGYKAPVVIANSKDSNSQRAADGFKQNFDKVNKNTVICNYSDVNALATALASCPLAKADSVYISSTAQDAVLVKAKIPASAHVYLTNMSYNGVNNSAQEFALKGATLGNMPWLLTDSQLKDSFMKSLPKANSQVQRIFASAYDAVNFAFTMTELSKDQNDVLHGLTGDISLGKDGLIESSAMWVELGKLR